MTVRIFFCFFLAMATQLNAQNKELKRRIIAGSAMFASGILDGTIESFTWHYESGFKRTCPNVNDQFWNPAVSWKNKYRDGEPEKGPKFFGSTTFLSATTDAYHLMRTGKRTIDGVTLAWYISEECTQKQRTKKQRLIKMATDFVILTAVRSAGFHLTYSLIFRRRT